MEFFTPPNTVGVLVTLAGLGFCAAEGGRTRWGNIYGLGATGFLFAVSNSISNRVHDDALAAKFGFSAGLLLALLPLSRVVVMSRIVPLPLTNAVGVGYMGYWAVRGYVSQIPEVEDQ